MISVYDVGVSDFTNNGSVVLMPTECTITEEAGGSYELALVHPIDEEGKWEHLLTGAIVRAPVPVRTIHNAWSGIEADIYATTTDASLRDGPSEPTRITYQTWSYGSGYSVGSRVTYGGNNYRCVYWDAESGQTLVPPSASSWWTRIANYTSGAAVIMTLAAWTELLFLSDAGDGWYYVSTWQGLEGYINTRDITYVRHQSAEELPDRVITEQLFRIYKVQIASTQQKTVTVNAKHVSYDLAGVIMSTCNIVRASPAMAITRMINAYMISYSGSIATNLNPSENGLYTGNVTGKSGIYGLMDPDNGMVNYFASQLQRDNWDIFIMKNDIVDHGIRLNYGKNLRGVTWTRDIGNLVTRVVPVAKAEDGSDLYLPERWIDSPYIGSYPVIRMEQLRIAGQVGRDDGTETGTVWTESSLYSWMRTKAGERFSVDKADGIATEVAVDFTRLGTSSEYAEFLGLDGIDMYDRITVTHQDIGLSQQLQVSYLEWDAIMKRYKKIKLGNVFDYGGRTTTGYSVGSEAIYYEKITQSTVDRIRDEAAGDVQPNIDAAESSAKSYASSRLSRARTEITDEIATAKTEAIEAAADATATAITTARTEITSEITTAENGAVTRAYDRVINYLRDQGVL